MAEIAKRLQSIALRFIGRLSAIKEDEDYSSGIAQLKVEERAKQKRLSKNKPRWVST